MVATATYDVHFYAVMILIIFKFAIYVNHNKFRYEFD